MFSALRNGRLYVPGNILGTHSSHRLSAVGRIKSMTPSGNEPMTFLFLAQCLNQLCHRVPTINLIYHMKQLILILGSKLQDGFQAVRTNAKLRHR
jgi:hypothetical protein